MRPDRSWMFRRKDPTGRVSEEFMDGVDEFIKFAKGHPTVVDSASRIPCPCVRCKNNVMMESFWVEKHLYTHGFKKDYVNWRFHGEDAWRDSDSALNIGDDEVKTGMETKLQHPVSLQNVYDRTYKRKSMEYVSECASNCLDTLDTATSQKHGEDFSAYPVVDPDVRLGAVGTSKKGRVHGIGHNLDFSPPTPGLSSLAGLTQTFGVSPEKLGRIIEDAVEHAMDRLLNTWLAPLLSQVPGHSPHTLPSSSRGKPHGEGPQDDGKDP